MRLIFMDALYQTLLFVHTYAMRRPLTSLAFRKARRLASKTSNEKPLARERPVSSAGSRPTITVQLGYAEALAYARHLRLARLVDYEQHAQDADEAHDMMEAGEKTLKQLERAGLRR
jgi:hypothetical protein